MRALLSHVALVAAVVCLGVSPHWAPTTDDLVALKHLALDHGAPIHYIAKSPSQMPPFDRNVFYPGDLDPGWIWENGAAQAASGYTRDLHNALILAAMDSGVAGEQWKQYYDALEAQDKAQTRNAADPYRFRHAFLHELDARLAALAPPLPQGTPGPALDAQASQFTDADLSLVARGLFATPVAPRTSALPPGVFARYDGKLGLGNYVMDVSPSIDEYEFYRDESPAGSGDAVMGARFEAVLDSGAAGADLKQRYDAAPDKAEFGIALARAFDLKNERTEATSRSEIAWMRASIHAGMTAKAVDALLRTRGLSLIYAHGSGSTEFPIRSNFACGTSIAVTVTFDRQQRVTNVVEQPPYTACL